MALAPINWNPDHRQLRTFGLGSLVLLGGIAVWVWLRHSFLGFDLGPTAAPVAGAALGMLAGVCGLLGAMTPRLLRPLYLGISVVAWPIGFVVSHVLLAIVFFGILTPVGLVMRLMSRNPLARGFDTDADTYWVRREPTRDVKRYFRQY